jgi:hypothetical protein
VIQRLERHARAERAVTDDCDYAARRRWLRSAAIAMPSAALIDVLEWPTPNVSYSLSERVGNGASRS